MKFELRDLLITLLPSSLTHFAAGPCDAGSGRPPGAPDVVSIENELTNVEIRLILQLALTQLGGAVAADEIRPRTLPELTALEGRLNQALEEVRDLRKKMGISVK
jgi:hypothetical protein